MVVQGVGQASMQAAPGRAPKDDDSAPKSKGSVGSNEPFSVSMPVTPCLETDVTDECECDIAPHSSSEDDDTNNSSDDEDQASSAAFHAEPGEIIYKKDSVTV